MKADGLLVWMNQRAGRDIGLTDAKNYVDTNNGVGEMAVVRLTGVVLRLRVRLGEI